MPADRNKVLTDTVRHLFNTIGKEDILTQLPNGLWRFEGKELAVDMQKLLSAEATQFINSKLWQILQADIKWQANQVMFENAKTEMDIVAGKLWLYTLDSVNTRLQSLSKGKGLLRA